MVGDVKQSIYRFRLADPAIFLSKYDAYPLLGAQAPGQPRKLLLSQNFRSRPEILEAVNDVFSLVMKKEAGGLDYTQAEALVPGAQFPDSPGPKVELHCLNYLASDEESGDKTGAEAEFVAARIERLLHEASVTENGAPVSTLYCYALIVLLNLIAIWRCVPEKPDYFQVFWRPAAAAAVMGIGARCIYNTLSLAMPGRIAVIMTAAERLQKEKLPHGRICIGFTPDEEIGSGAKDSFASRPGTRRALRSDRP